MIYWELPYTGARILKNKKSYSTPKFGETLLNKIRDIWKTWEIDYSVFFFCFWHGGLI